MPERLRLLVVDVGLGPRPSWFLPRLRAQYDVHVVWLLSGNETRDNARLAMFAAELPEGAHTVVPYRSRVRETILATAAVWSPHGIATTCGDEIVTEVHAVCHALGLPGNDVASLPALRDKHIQRTMLHNAGLPVPRFAAVDSCETLVSALDHVGTPAVLKPVAGSGSMATFRIGADTDVPQTWARACAAYLSDARGNGTVHFVLEQFIAGRRRHADARYGCQVSVESIVGDGNVVHLAITDKLALVPDFREVADILPSTLPAADHAELYTVTTAALRALGITNSAAHTEIMLPVDGPPMVIEVNSRIGGGVAELLHHAYDYDLMSALAAVATGKAVPLPGPPRRFASLHTPQAPQAAGRLVAVPSPDELRCLPGVVDAVVTCRVGDTPDCAAGTKGGMLAYMIAVADEPAALLDLAAALSSDTHFRYDTKSRW